MVVLVIICTRVIDILKSIDGGVGGGSKGDA